MVGNSYVYYWQIFLYFKNSRCDLPKITFACLRPIYLFALDFIFKVLLYFTNCRLYIRYLPNLKTILYPEMTETLK